MSLVFLTLRIILLVSIYTNGFKYLYKNKKYSYLNSIESDIKELEKKILHCLNSYNPWDRFVILPNIHEEKKMKM